jgi:FKBP-type peptidyl-prolyl cis-trans isomerase
LTSLPSCIKKTDELEREETAKVQAYLAANPSLDFELKGSGLYYYEIQAGTGVSPVSQDTVYLYYTVKLLDGTELYSNVDTDDTLKFVVNEGYVIKGLDEGITYMKEGGQSLLLIPSKLAYGASGDYYYIGGYTPLLFEIELLRVKQGSGSK